MSILSERQWITMCVYFYCTLRVLIKKSEARPGNKSGIKEEKIGQQDDQTIFFQFFKGFWRIIL